MKMKNDTRQLIEDAVAAAVAACSQNKIEATTLYPIQTLMQITRLGATALRRMRREGLVIRYVGSRAFCLGSDFTEAVLRIAKTKKFGGPGRKKNQAAGEVPAAT